MRSSRWIFALWLAAIGALVPQRALAGLGPENVFLVVNRASWASLTVANHYASLRQIPTINICYLDWRGGTDSTDVETFREQILRPVLTQIERRSLADQIDAIVYSSDFPYQVNLTGDLGGQVPPKQLSPVASLTGATFLWQLVMTKNPNVIGLQNNQYTRASKGRATDPATQGFRSWYGWGNEGALVEAGGLHYLLSTMLAVTSGRGNSVPEAVGYLRTAQKADATHPPGTIYYCATDDKRSTARSDRFLTAIDALKEVGVKGEVVNGVMPSGKNDVVGLMMGTATFDWTRAQSRILPGAFCENFTSFGGALSEGSGQTPLTELLRYGAAGSCGTVVEPYAIAEKFPVAEVQVHYARGCTLAESFYQSVFGPYQLLVVGDPLCQPWAQPPKIVATGVAADDVLSGKVDIKPGSEGNAADRFLMFLDGQRIGRRPSGSTFSLDTSLFADGHHELTIVGVAANSIETQGRLTLPIVIDNLHHRVELVADRTEARWGEPFALSVKAPGLAGGLVIVNGVAVEQFKGEEAKVTLALEKFGTGPCSVRAVGITKDSPPKSVTSPTLSVSVLPQSPLPALSLGSGQQLTRGFQLKTLGGGNSPVQETRASDWLHKAGVKPNERYGLDAYFAVSPPDRNTIATAAADVARHGMHQFQLTFSGQLKIAVDNQVLLDATSENRQQHFLPVPLAPGLHRLRIAGTAGKDVRLQILYGGEGTQSIDGTRFRQLGP